MNRITYEDLSFENQIEAKNVIEKHKLILFQDIDDVIICYHSTSEVISKRWNQLLTEIALYFQANLDDEILSRNLLLVFCCSDYINVELKKEIQSDTYCCRKIVRSNITSIDAAIKDLLFLNIDKIVKKESLSLKKFIENNHPEVFEMLRAANEF